MATSKVLASASLLLAANAAAAPSHDRRPPRRRQLRPQVMKDNAIYDRALQAPATKFPTFSPTDTPSGIPTFSPEGAATTERPSEAADESTEVPSTAPSTAAPVAAASPTASPVVTPVAPTEPAPANDQCETGITLASLPYTSSGSTVGATADFAMASCGAAADASGVWYAYTPSETKVVSVTVDNGQSVRVYSGECDSLECLAGLEPARDFVGEANVDYRFLVSEQNFSDGAAFTIEVEDYAVPRNDRCADALAVQSLPFFFSGTTLGALPDFDANSCGAFLFANGVWFSYTSATDVNLAASVTGDQQLRIYSGNCDETVDDLACVGELSAAQNFRAAANVEYQLLVSSETFDVGGNFAISLQEGEIPGESPSGVPSGMPLTRAPISAPPTPRPSPGPTAPQQCDVRDDMCPSELVCCTAPGATSGQPDTFDQVCTSGSVPGNLASAALEGCGLGPISDVVCTDLLTSNKCTPTTGEVCCKISDNEFGCREINECLGVSTPVAPGPTRPPASDAQACDVDSPDCPGAASVCCTEPGATPGDPDTFASVCLAGSSSSPASAALESCGIGPVEDRICTDFLEPTAARCTPGFGEVCCKISANEFGCRDLRACVGMAVPTTPGPTPDPTPRPTREPSVGEIGTASPVRTRPPATRPPQAFPPTPPSVPVTTAPTYREPPTDECHSKASKLFKASKYGSMKPTSSSSSGITSSKSHKSAKCKSVKGKASKTSKSGKSVLGKDRKEPPSHDGYFRDPAYMQSRTNWAEGTASGTMGGESSVAGAIGAVAAAVLLVFVGVKFGIVEYRRRRAVQRAG